MPTIMFDGNFSKLEKTILTKTFKANCKKLGLEPHNVSVQVRKVPLGSPNRYARVAYPDEQFFLVEINSNGFNLFDATSSLGHEAVHMKQHLNGELVDGRHGQYWNGELYGHFKTMMSGNDVPWEKEAWGMQGELHKHAVASLSPQEQRYIDQKHSHGLNRLW